MNNNKYIELSNLSAMYDEKTNNISIIGKKNMYEDGFKVTLKQGSYEDIAMRKELFLPEIGEIATNIQLDLTYPLNLPPRLNQIPLGLDKSGHEINWTFNTNKYGKRMGNMLLITGKVNCGKTTLLNHIVEVLDAHYTASNVLYISENDGNADENINRIFDSLLNTTYNNAYDGTFFVVIDRVNNLKEKTISQIRELSKIARSTNLVLILAGNQSYDMKQFANHSDKIYLSTVNCRDRTCRAGMLVADNKTEVFQSYLPQPISQRMDK